MLNEFIKILKGIDDKLGAKGEDDMKE